jgi:hypothetical protein
MCIDCIDLLSTVESTYKVYTGITAMEALGIPSTNGPAIHFFNERNQNRKLAKISRDPHAHRQTANLGFPSALGSFGNPVSLSFICIYLYGSASRLVYEGGGTQWFAIKISSHLDPQSSYTITLSSLYPNLDSFSVHTFLFILPLYIFSLYLLLHLLPISSKLGPIAISRIRFGIGRCVLSH